MCARPLLEFSMVRLHQPASLSVLRQFGAFCHTWAFADPTATWMQTDDGYRIHETTERRFVEVERAHGCGEFPPVSASLQ